MGRITASVAASVGAFVGFLLWITAPEAVPLAPAPEPPPPHSAEPYRLVQAYVTGYNTVPRQTDETPCIAATGGNICGRNNVVACPRSLPLGTIIEIQGKEYICEDRTARKFDGRFDINCDKDRRCPFAVAGWVTVKVFVD